MPALARSVVRPLLNGAHVTPKSRPEVVVVGDVRLRFVPQPRTQRQALADADVVLHVQAGVHIPVLDQRIADADRERGRLSGVICRQAREAVRAEVVRRVIGPERSAFEQHARADGVHAANVVDVRRKFEVEVVPSARHLRAAARERVGHVNGRRLECSRATPLRVQFSSSRDAAKVRRPSGPLSWMRNS